jgi:hypothetical protein
VTPKRETDEEQRDSAPREKDFRSDAARNDLRDSMFRRRSTGNVGVGDAGRG